MNLIVAVDNNWAIGKDNKLLISIPADMKFFRSKTLDSVVIMGRKTLESFPNANPLPNRVNIVITKETDYKKENAIVVHSIEEAIKEAKKYNKEIYVIGGASIYKQMLNYCDTAYITKISKEFIDADTFFPNLNSYPAWELVEESESEIHDGILYKFTTYKRK